jgi:cytochrome c-type biogenesis protein CcmH/NrfG
LSTENTTEEYVKKETLWIATLIALACGFLSGVVFSAFKSPVDTPASSQQVQQQPSQQQNNTQNLNADLLALEQAVQKNPTDTNAWVQLGHLYFDSQKIDKAIYAYNKYLEFIPNNADVLTDLGVMYRRSGKHQEAVASFEKANKINPDHPTALFNLGIVLFYDLNDKEAALKAWQQLISKHPDAKAPNGQLVSDIMTSIKSKSIPQ